MTVIGLTGGIASGKSTAAEMLRDLGASIIDADRLGHRSYEPGTPGFQKVVNAFGHDIVAKDGTIDRRILGGKVFGAPGQLERLNAIVWPEIRALIEDEVKQLRAQESDPIIVLEAAVLLEASWQDLCDEVWVVVTPVATAVERMKSRNGLSEDAAMARINAQMTNKERAEAAHVKIENASTEDDLHARVERAWRSLQTRLGRKLGPRSTRQSTAKATKTGTVKRSSSKAAASGSSARSGTKAAAKPSTAAKSKPATSKAAGAKPATRPASGSSSAKAAPAKTASSKAKTPTSKPDAKPSASKAEPAARAAGARTTTRTAAAKASTKKAPSTKAKAAPASASRSTAKKPASRGSSRAK